MKSQKDCQEFYAALLEKGVVVDNRFTYRGSTWPYQLVLQSLEEGVNPQVEIKLPVTVPEHRPDETVVPAVASVPSSGRVTRQPKKLSANVSVAASAPAKKKKKTSSASSNASKRRRDEDAAQMEFCLLPEHTPANVIRAKVLDGDEVIVYHSRESKIPMSLLRDVVCCTACGAFEEQFRMLGCAACGQFYHNFCLNMKNMPEDLASWKCPSCKRCEKCHLSGHDECLLVCEVCDLGFHTFCLDPPLPFIPHGDWLCASHALCKSCGTKTAGDHPNHTWHDNDTLCHLCWTRIRNKNQCPSCLKAYDNDQWDSHMVGCDCGRWVHRGCDGISMRLYQELQMPNRQEEPYWCVVCRSSDNKPQFQNPELLAMVEVDLQQEQLLQMNPPPPSRPNAVAPRPDVVTEEICRSVLCSFCGLGSSGALLGRLVPLSRVSDKWVHCGCAIWSRDVVLRKTGGVSGLVEALERAMNVECRSCSRTGASLQCRARGCEVAYHLPCALNVPQIAMHRVNFMCPEHSDPARPAPPLPIEVGVSKAFVTLPPQFRAERRAADAVGVPLFTEQSWEDRIKSFIAKNPSAFLNQQYEESLAASKSSGRDVPFRAMSSLVNEYGTMMQRGSLLISSFGSVRFDPAFHSSRYIFPVGFVALRRFWSYLNQDRFVLYRCSILANDSGNAPVFRIEAEDDMANPVVGDSPSTAWEQLAKRFGDSSVRGSGDMCWREEMFGLTAWTVQAIECLPGSGNCSMYNFQFWPRASVAASTAAYIDHPDGCARAIPYSKGRKAGSGAFVYEQKKNDG
jgi:hypothetical protein